MDVLEPIHAEPQACPECGSTTERAWLTRPPSVVGDETDFVSHNGERHPVRFRSKADHRLWLKTKGYTINDDKSQHEAGGKQWLENAEILATRNGAARGSVVHDDEPPLNYRFYGGELTKAEAAEYARKNRQ